MNFSTKFRLLRAKSGLTQAEIADKLGITGRAVGAWESGRSKPRLDKMAEIAVLFDTTVADLMGEDAAEAAISGTSRMVPCWASPTWASRATRGTSPTRSRSASIADAHPRGFMVHAQGGCMDNRFPHDALLLVDPDMEPVNGQPVLAETSDYGAVVRNYTRGRSTVMLTADSHSGEYDDILAGPDDAPVVCKGRVVWYMGERDER